MTLETAKLLAEKPRSYSLGSQAAFALKYPSFVALVGGEVIAGAGVYIDLHSHWRAWVVIPAIGFRQLRWIHGQMREFLIAFNKPVRAAIEAEDGAGYVFAISLGFTRVVAEEQNAGRHFILLERGI